MVNGSTASAAMMANQTVLDATLPPLPAYTLEPTPDLLSWVSDSTFSIVVPIIVYWVVSLFFHVIDVLDLFPQYRLHTPEEITRRNHVTRYEVFRDVIIQQVIQFMFAAVLALTDPTPMTGREDYDVAVWATRIRLAQRALPSILGLVGLDASAISKNMLTSHPLLAGALAGGYYPSLTVPELETPAFASWELLTAKFIYNILIPVLRLFAGAIILDAWQYGLHRFMHMNKYMYTKFHSRHHRLYVPYAYGALYNHPVEGFLLDTLGSGIAFWATGMSLRQGTLFFSISTIKTVDDHCGYHFPWDPLQLISSNNAAYHDIHHQTWGIKTNFSQPYFTFWDKMLGTMYTGPRTDRLADRKRVEQAK
jgi:sphinganine C4-monooxygenase